MEDIPDIDALARRYLDLWQDQLGELAADEDLAAAMAEALGLMSTGAATVAAMTRAAAKQGQEQDERAATSTGKRSEANGAAAVAPSSGGADVGLDDLARRVAELEQRLAALEAESGDGGKRSAPRPRRRRT